MKIIISPRAEKQLKKLSRLDQIIIAQKLRQFPPTTNVKPLKGYSHIFRFRLGNYRIVYRQINQEIYIIAIGHRRDIYKLLSRL